MIFDILILMCTGILFSLCGVLSFVFGASYESRREHTEPKKEGDGWEGIINFDHSKKGGEER